MVTITAIRWRDACAEEASTGGEVVPELADLLAVGVLAGETDEVVTVALEYDFGAEEVGRWRLHIPKSCVVSRVDLPLPRPKRR
jgi:hypothetical protein